MIRYKTLIGIAIFAVLLIAIFLVSMFLEIDSKDAPEYLDATRTAEALIKPNIPYVVDNIRIQAKVRDCGDNIPEGYTALQIYYGYFVDSKWYDYPCENYDLKGIYIDRAKFGYDAAGENHIVKIGDKILIALPTWRNGEIEVKDTLGSKVIVMDEYYTSTVPTETSGNYHTGYSMVGEGYAYLKENALELGEDDYNFSILGAFDKWYYVTIDESELTDDYTLTFTNIGAENSDFDFIVTYNDIITALNYANEVEPK